MNNTRKHISKIVLASALVLAAACGSDSNVGTSGDSSPATSVEQAPDTQAQGASVAPPNAGEGPLQHRSEDGEGAPESQPAAPNGTSGDIGQILSGAADNETDR